MEHGLSKREKILIAMLAILVVALGVFSFSSPGPQKTTVTQFVHRELPNVSVPKKLRTITYEQNLYPTKSPDFSYWVAATGTYPINTPFAKNAEEYVKTFVHDFIADYRDTSAFKQEKVLDNSVPLTANAETDFSYGVKLMSYLYSSYRYDGGAHGNTYFDSETFDMNGKKYSLGDIFLPNSNYLYVISQMATKYFMEDENIAFNPKDPVWGNSLDPKPENFATFFIDGDDIIFQFQQYQIASYAQGAPTFSVSVTDPEIRKIVRPELFGL